MSKTWKLLTKKEIKSLNQGDLEDYLLWLNKYKKEKLYELVKKKAVLDKINKENHDAAVKEKTKKDQEEIEKIREDINNIT